MSVSCRTKLSVSPCPAKTLQRAAGLAILVLLLAGAGCGRRIERSPAAAPLPLLESDPMEDGVDAGRWPGWRGRNGQGIASGGSPAVQFGPEKNIAWKADVPGRGWSSPIVWDERIVLTTALDTTDPPTLAVLCYARRDGSPLWRREVGQAVGPTHSKNGYASATPVTDGHRVYSYFGSTGLFCHDLATGEPVWRADLGRQEHRWGTAASPLLFEDCVIQLCDSGEESYLAAFDRATGERRWRTERPFSDGCWSTPVVVESRDASTGAARAELIVNGGDEGSGGAVWAYDPATGRLLWTLPGTTQWVTPTPVVAGGHVISVSGRKGPILAISPGGSGDASTRVVWRQPKEGSYIPSPVAYRNRLFVLGDARTLDCYDAGDGRHIWRIATTGNYTASLVAADGRLYMVDETGTVMVVSADDHGKLLAQNRFRERCLATPAIVDGHILLRTESRLYFVLPEETP